MAEPYVKPLNILERMLAESTAPGPQVTTPDALWAPVIEKYAPTATVLPPFSGRQQGETGADWTAPFQLPRLSTAEFELMKAKYVAKFGYKITIPGLEDIFHVTTIQPMTPDEIKHWKRKDWTKFSPERYSELKEHKTKKRARFLAMLGSPSPQILRNAGAILTAIDNAQDALTTLSVIGRLAIKYAPRLIGKALLGPVGWIMTAADVLNLMMLLGRKLTLPLMSKRAGAQATAGNPFSKAAKIKRAAKIMKPFPTVGNVIEIAQTTDNIFGIGLSLGPIVGLMQDVAAGSVRSLLGQKVQLKTAPPRTSPALYAAAKVPKAITLIMASGYEPDDELLLELATAYYLSLQELYSNNEGWNALDSVQDVETCQVSVPVPENVLSLEVMEEEGDPREHFGGWPHSARQWAVTSDIVNAYSTPGNDFLRWAMETHKHDWLGHVLGNLFTDSYDYSMATLEGPENIEVNYTEQAKFMEMMLKIGVYPDPDQPREKLRLLDNLLTRNDFDGTHMTTLEYISTLASAGIKMLRMGDRPIGEIETPYVPE